MDFVTRYISDWITAHYDPFYGYVGIGLLVILAATAASWYFPVLRSLAGAIVFSVVAILFGFRKGEQAEQIREKALEDMSKPSAGNSWDWGSSDQAKPKPPKGGKNQ